MSRIAIVGMGARFAQAPDLTAYWQMILEARDGFGPVPADRWDHDTFYDPSPRATDKTSAPRGGFIEDVRSFPALALGIPPRRVEVMDPQQRFTIEVCLQAIEDAGYGAPELPHRTGVFVGVTGTEYRQIISSRVMAQMMASGHLGRDIEDPSAFIEAVERTVPSRPFTAPGVLANMNAASVAQELDLHGPAYTVDSACASSLVAVNDAVLQLRAGVIDAALAGGVYLCLTPEHHVAFARIGAMSPSGFCRPFDARADGFVQGDGVGAVLLKRYEDAVRDGDRIYAVIHGVATNNDGRGDGPMAPVQSGQEEVIQAAWKDAAIDPLRLGYIEAHGTGTSTGDVTEIGALKATLGERIEHARLGSAKANVGHTMSAAGVAGLMRAALSVHQSILPPLAGFENAREDLELGESRFELSAEARNWESQDRVAGVSSFGFGGTNAHVVLGNTPDEARVSVQVAELPAQPELVLMSAPSEAQLRDICARTASVIEADANASVAGVARAWAKRPAQRWRVGLVVRDRNELLATLRKLADGKHCSNTALGEAPEEAPKVCFMYPGQGSQRLGMLAGIRDRFGVVNETLEQLEAALQGEIDLPLTQLLYPERRDTPVDENEARAQLTDTANQQPALLSAGVALTRVLELAGVKPDVLTGHSLGEITATVAAGVLPAADAARFAARRGRLMRALDGDHGAMAAIMTDRETTEGLLVDGAVIANLNHPRQTVVSGRTTAVAEVVEKAKTQGLKAVALDVSHGFHSPVLEALEVETLLQDIPFGDAQLPLSSGVAPRHYGDADDARAILRGHATSPVDFFGALARCREEGASVFLQVGAGGPLSAFARGSLPRGEVRVLNLAGTDDDDFGASLLQGLAQLFVAGVAVDPRAFTAAAELATLPPVELPREPYWAIKDDVQLSFKLQGAKASKPAPKAASQPAPQPALVAEPEGSGDPIADKVIELVAAVSAYPKASLKPGLTLVDELGFDSLMVTELVSQLGDAFPGLGAIPQELLLNRPTVQMLIDHVRSAADQTIESQDDDAPLDGYRPVWYAAALPERGGREWRSDMRVQLAGPGADSLRGALGELTLVDAKPELIVWVASAERPVGGSWHDASAPLLALLAENVEHKPALVVLHRDDDVWAEALRGVARSLRREWSMMAKAIAYSPEVSVETRAGAIVKEWCSADRSADLRYSVGGRYVLGFERTDRPESRLELGRDDAVLITGGTRGIGAKLAARLVGTGARVIVAGRSAPSAEVQALIEASEGRVALVQADVCDRDAFVAAVEPHGPVTALVHSAGLLADGALESIDPARGELARRVKGQGLLNAVAACGDTLKVAVGLGSWAGRFGNRHQLHYSAANALLAGLTRALPSRVRSTVLEFGPWSDSEMVRTIPTAVQATMRAEGVDFVGDNAGLDAIIDALRGADGELVMGRRVPETTRALRFTESLTLQTHPYLRDHVIEGYPVMPTAMAAELMAEAAQLQSPFEIERLRLFKGVTVEDETKIETRIEGERAELRIAGDGLCWRGRVRSLAPTAQAPTLEKLGNGATADLSLEAFYRDVTFHGPLIQAVTAIDALGKTTIRGRVRTCPPQTWMPGTDREQWITDPMVFDGGLQLCAYAVYNWFRRAGTPVAVARYTQWAPMPTEGELIVEAQLTDHSADHFEAEIRFRDLEGQIIAVAEGVEAELLAVEEKHEAGAYDFAPKQEWIDPAEWPEIQDLNARLEMAEAMGMHNPYFAVHQGTARNVTTVDSRELINFSSYNYLGLSGDGRVLAEAKAAMDRYGTSVSASRVASGERPFHQDLEKALAKAQGAEDSIVFTAGHATNVTTVGHLFGAKDLVLHDALIHDSILQGIKLSGAARRAFKHEDTADLEAQLRELRPHYEKVLIIVEGVYSMDGDICDLPKYLELKKRYGCLLMVDEAHSFGIVGKTGRGVGEHFGIDGGEVDLWMGTLSKSLASCGGWIAGPKNIIQYLRYTAPGFVYSAGITPANAQAALSALHFMTVETERVEKLQSNAQYFHSLLTELGVNTGPAEGESGVIPVITGSSMTALQLSTWLLERGVNVQPIMYPAVADDAARLRFFLSSTHSREELRATASLVAEGLRELGVLESGEATPATQPSATRH